MKSFLKNKTRRVTRLPECDTQSKTCTCSLSLTWHWGWHWWWIQLTSSDLGVLSLYMTMFMYIIVVAACWDWSRGQICFLCKLKEHGITVLQQSVRGIELQDSSITENQDSVKQNSSLIFMWFLPFALTQILLFCTTTYFIILRLDIIYTSIKLTTTSSSSASSS